MANSVDPDQTDPDLGPPCLLLYLDLSVMLGNYLQQTSKSTSSFRYIFSWRFLGLKDNS